jgi:hypothetical protein
MKARIRRPAELTTGGYLVRDVKCVDVVPLFGPKPQPCRSNARF